jgi:hypothetical protein
MKKGRIKGRVIGVILALVMLVGLLAVPSAAVANGSVEVLMCLVLDSSGSISTSEWNTMIGGLTSALDATLPIDGSVEMCVVQFASSAAEEVAPIVVDSQTDKDFVINEIQTITRNVGSSTYMNTGIDQAVTTMQSSTNYNNAAVWKVINMATDGAASSESLAETAAGNAVSAGIDELDVESIGSGPDNDWLAEEIVIPDGPGGNKGAIVPPDPYPSRPPSMGFVRVCSTFDDYESAIAQKLILLLKGQLYLEPEQDTNDLSVETEHCVIATLNDGFGQPVVGANVTFTVTGANSAGPTDVETDINGEAEFCYTGTNVGTDTIIASATDPQDVNNTLESDPAYKEWFRGEEPPPPIEVGGDVSPVNRISLLVPWIGLGAIAAAIAGVTLVLRRRRI